MIGRGALRRDSALALVDQGVALASNLILVAILARGLGPGPVGWYAGTLAFAGLITTGTNLGVQVVMGREVARRPARAARYLVHAALVRGAFTVPVTLLLALTGALLFLEDTPLPITLLVTGYALALGGIGLLYTFFMSAGAFGRFAAVNAPLKMAGVAVAWAVMAAGGGLAEVVGALLLTACVALGALALLARPWLHRRPPPLRLRPRLALALTKRSLPLAPAALAEFTSLKVDQVLLLAMLGGGAAGIYGVAAQLYLALLMVPLVLTKAFLPHFTRLQEHDPSEARAFLGRYVAVFLGISTFSAALAVALGGVVVREVFGSGFESAATVLALLAPALLLTSLNRLYNHALIGLGENRWCLLVSSAGAGLNVVGNVLLIPLWGPFGAAAMTVATEGAVLVGSGLRVKSRLSQRVGRHAPALLEAPEPKRQGAPS